MFCVPDVRKSIHSQSAADATVCVCVYMFFKHLLVQHLCSHVVLFLCYPDASISLAPTIHQRMWYLIVHYTFTLFISFFFVFYLCYMIVVNGVAILSIFQPLCLDFYRFSAISASCCALFLLQKWIQHTYRNIMRYNDDYYVFRLW